MHTSRSLLAAAALGIGVLATAQAANAAALLRNDTQQTIHVLYRFADQSSWQTLDIPAGTTERFDFNNSNHLAKLVVPNANATTHGYWSTTLADGNSYSLRFGADSLVKVYDGI